ncbi:MAG: photosystem II reaction center protein Psb28 [Cyanobacteria bacterium P01_H01_bin.119]
MAVETPTIEFYEGILENVSNIGFRRNRTTGGQSMVLVFEQLKAIEQFNSFRNRFAGTLNLTDSEGKIAIEPSDLRFVFGGPEGDDLIRVECILSVDREDHWQRLMRFIERYAAANGMAYGEREQGNP